LAEIAATPQEAEALDEVWRKTSVGEWFGGDPHVNVSTLELAHGDETVWVTGVMHPQYAPGRVIYVERYPHKVAAVAGHDRWVASAKAEAWPFELRDVLSGETVSWRSRYVSVLQSATEDEVWKRIEEAGEGAVVVVESISALQQMLNWASWATHFALDPAGMTPAGSVLKRGERIVSVRLGM
jgi:hypothetical protein